jgi:hypothetical protein
MLLVRMLQPECDEHAGFAGYARVAKDAGNLNWETAINTRTPGFEVNDISFLSRADYIWQLANVTYNWVKPTSWYRYLYVLGGGQQQWTYDGNLNDRQVQIAFGGQSPQFWGFNGFYLLRPQVLDDRQLRGGPLATRPGQYVVNLGVQTDNRRSVVLGPNLQFARNTEGGFSSNVSMNARFKPASNVSVSFGPSYQLTTGIQQYVTAIDDPTATLFYGKRYVLSSLTQKTLSLDTRLKRHVHTERDARAVHAAIHRERRLLQLQGVRRAASGTQEHLRS